jgi:two-component system chemotaxis response regulator CheB
MGPREVRPPRASVIPRLIGIVSATGGFEALEEILSSLPREFAAPILVVPSIHPDYVAALAARLDEKSLLMVTVAEDGQVPSPGCVYVAANDRCLRIVEGRLRLGSAHPYCNARPKNALFYSMAREKGVLALAVILSGMGADGAEGMKELRDAGGYTIVQDQSTSVVYGPAKAAVQLDAVCESLPVKEIGPRLVRLIAQAPLNRE